MKVNKQEIEVEKVVKVKEQAIIIELSLEEAKVVKALSGSVVGGGPTRVITDNLYHKLDSALNVEFFSSDYFCGTISTNK